MSTIKFNQWLNPDNTENYKCRAWVNFNGTGTVAIRASGNVSSITDNGVGDYTVNFAAAFSDVNYAALGSAHNPGVATGVFNGPAASSANKAVGSFRVTTFVPSSGAPFDYPFVDAAFFR